MQQFTSERQTPAVRSTGLQFTRGKRKWAPKSRDGCMICRSRRVKCDEARPSCFRCRRMRVECRYATPGQINPGLQGRDSGPAQNQAHLINWSRSLSYGTPEETRYLGTFRHLATPWLNRYVCKSLFSELMPRASWSHPGLRHALVAASMASEQYLCRPLQVRPHRREWHYARALQHLYQDINLNGDIATMAAYLLCLHDMIMKDTTAAMVHIIGFLGMTIEKKLRKISLSRTADIEITVIRCMTGFGHNQSVDTRELPDRAVIDGIRARLASARYADAAGERSHPHDEYEFFMFATGWLRERDGVTAEYPDGLYFDEMYDFADRWYLEFSSRPRMSDFEQQLLFHYHKLSYFVLDGLKPDSHYVDDSDYESLKWTEDVLNWLESIDHEIFTQVAGKEDLILPLHPLLAIVEYRSKSREVRTRVVALLEKYDRLEGMWTSMVLAKGVYGARLEHIPNEVEATVSKASLEWKVDATMAKESAEDGKER